MLRYIIIFLAGALGAFEANRGIAVFNDAVRPIVPEYREGRMFLQQITEQNPQLVQEAIRRHQSGEILPDTFLVDLDTLLDNAEKIKRTADQHHIDLYFMLKQLGHNPYIAEKLLEIGYPGAVVVDWKEAELMMQHRIPIMNAGHLVQPPAAFVRRLVDYGCEYFTVYTLEKIREINEAAKAAGIVQKLLLRITDDNSVIYSGQSAGFRLAELDGLIRKTEQFDHVRIAGVTSFPCFLYSEKNNRIEPTQNMESLQKAKEILERHGLCNLNINAPSATCVSSLQQMDPYGVTSSEPGHGLTGTTPLHADQYTGLYGAGGFDGLPELHRLHEPGIRLCAWRRCAWKGWPGR